MSANCTTHEPTSEELFAYYSNNSAAIVLIVFMSLFSIATVLLYFEAVSYINKKVNDSRTRIRLMVILGIYPVYSTTSLLALYVPRSHLITYLTATLYFSVALYQFLLLIVSYFGGREQLVERLKDTKIPVASPPLLCCIPCLPKPDMTARNLIRLRRMVLQVAFIRPICNFISLILWANGTYILGKFTADSAYVWLSTIALCSTFLALYAVIILMRISSKALEGYNVQPKFLLVQLVLVLITLQLVIVGLFVLLGMVPCDPPFPTLTRGYYYCDLLTVAEMLIFIIFARLFFRKRIDSTPSGRDHPDHHYNVSKKDLEAQNEVKEKDITTATYHHLDSQTSNGNGVIATTTPMPSYNNNNAAYVNEAVNEGDIDEPVDAQDDKDEAEITLDIYG